MPTLDTAFPWIGLAGAFVLICLLTLTTRLQADKTASRWRDLTWLSWAGASAYLLHNVEEYGVDLLGRAYAFPPSVCGMFGFRDLADCPAPTSFFTSVNVSMFWLAAPAAALLSKRHPLVGLAIYGVMAVNLVAHVVGGLGAGTVYNPGWLTAVALFLPLTVWMAHVVLRGDRLSHAALIFLAASGVVLHVILAGSLILLMKGREEDSAPILWIQLLNASLLVGAPWLAERWRHGVLVRGGSGQRGGRRTI